MHRGLPAGRLLQLVLAASFVALAAGRLAAIEQVQPFVDGLRERHFFEEAIEYLDRLRNNEQVPTAVRERIDFEQGALYLQSAAAISDFALKDKQLAQARAKLDQFCQQHPNHDLVASAKGYQAGILVEQGRIKAGMARQGQNPQAKSLLAEARHAFDGAKQDFGTAVAGLDAQLQKMPRHVPPEDRELAERKSLLADELARSRLNVANCEYEIAKTCDGDESKKHFKAAAELYAKIFEDYRMRQAGLLAHLWEGVCYQELGETQQAVGCYKDIMDLELTPSQRKLLRSIRNKGYRQALECWTSRQEHKYAAAIERGEQWSKEEGAVDSEPDGLAIRYYLAVAYEQEAQALPAKDPARRKYTANASKYVIEVARHPGEFQKPAKALREKLAGKEEGEGAESEKEPATFAEAVERGKVALDGVQASTIGQRMAQEQNDTAQLAEMQKNKAQYEASAFRNFRLAMSLLDKVPAKEKPDLKEVNSIRYYLCFLYYDSGEYYDAAVLGDFLARRYPEALEGRQGARIALASFVKLQQESKDPDKSFELEHLEQIAEYITKHWPNEEEAEQASLTLLNLAIQQRQLGRALEYLKLIPESSPGRGASELRAGQALWATYLKAAHAPAEERPAPEELERFKTNAQKVLSDGIERVSKSGEVTPTVVGAMLSLAQIYLDMNDTDHAVATLEDKKLGPLTLVRAKSEAAAREGFAIETYKLALRAYVAKQDVKNAKKVMDSLEKAVNKSGDAKAGETLTLIYISLGRELQQHLERLRKSGQKQQLDAVSGAFETFLSRIIDRPEGNNFSSLSWVAETFYSLGTGFDDGTGAPGDKAKAYYSKAVKAYEKILERAGQEPGFAPPESLVGIRLRMAICQRRLGNFESAIKLISGVLKERPYMLTAQIEGASTYQAEGATEPTAYLKAMGGGEPSKEGENVIWGWGKLAKKTQQDPKFSETFYLARLKLAESRFDYGRAAKDKKKRTDLVQRAKDDIRLTYKLYPSLGGAELAARYDRLLKRIQEFLKQKPLGLKEFGEDTETASTAEQ